MSLKIDKIQLDIIINNDQSRKQLRLLDDEMRQLQKDLKKLPEGTQEWIDKSNRLKSVQQQYENVKREIGLTGITLKELRQHQQELNLVMKNMNPNLKQYKVLQSELTQTNARIKELTVGAKASGMSLSSIATGMNKYWMMITAGAAAFTGVILGFKQLVPDFNDYEKKVDNLSALTGLFGDDLTWLSDQAKTLSTSMIEGTVRITQNADAIVDAYTKVGSARPELLKNKEALNQVTQEAIILSQAANSELQPAVDALTMVLNQFNAPAEDSRRIINSLAAGSKAGAGEIPYLTQAIEKSGTVAADVGMSYESLIGTIETLAPRITAPEIAGRTLKGVILALQQTADDTNPAIVGFAQAIENLGKKHLSTAELIKIFGTENITAAKILINNQEETKNYTKAVTDTNVAIEQATINTDNNSSKLAQAKNKAHLMALELGEKLAPALTFSTNSFMYFLKAIMASIEFFNKYKATIIAITAGIAAYTIAVNLSTISFKIQYYWLLLVEKATKAFNTAIKSNPWGLVAAGIAAVIAYLVLYEKKISVSIKLQKELDNVSKETNKRIIDEHYQLAQLLKIAKDETKTKIDRQEAIKKLNEISPEYLGNLTLETINTTKAKDAVTLYIKELERKYKVEILGEKIKAEMQRAEDLKGSDENISRGGYVWNLIKNFGNVNKAVTESVNDAIKTQENAISDSKELIAGYEKELEKLIKTSDVLDKKTMPGDGDDLGSGKGQLEKLLTAYEKLNKEIATYEALLKDQVLAHDKNVPKTAKLLADKVKEKEEVDDLIKAYQEYYQTYKEFQELKPKEYKPEEIVPKEIKQNDKEEEEWWLNEEAKNSAILQSAKATADAVFEIWKNNRDAKLDAELSAIEKQRKAELSSKNLTEAQIAAINEKYDEQTRAKKREQWRKDKNAAIIQQNINTSLAVMAELAKDSWWGAAAAGAMGAVQLAVIAAQKMPEFSKGGFTAQGNNKDVAGLVHANEYVVPAWQMQNPVTMNYVGVLEAIRQNRGFAAGGPTSTNTITNNTQSMFSDPELKDIMKQILIESKKPKQSYVLNRDIEELNTKIDAVKEKWGG